MEVVLLALAPNDDAIQFQEGWALVHEVRGDLREAVRYREKEITQLELLFRIDDEDERPKEAHSDWSSAYKEAADSYVRAAMLYEKLGEPQPPQERTISRRPRDPELAAQGGSNSGAPREHREMVLSQGYLRANGDVTNAQICTRTWASTKRPTRTCRKPSASRTSTASSSPTNPKTTFGGSDGRFAARRRPMI